MSKNISNLGTTPDYDAFRFSHPHGEAFAKDLIFQEKCIKPKCTYGDRELISRTNIPHLPPLDSDHKKNREKLIYWIEEALKMDNDPNEYEELRTIKTEEVLSEGELLSDVEIIQIESFGFNHFS